MGLVRDQQRTLAELVQEVRALNAAVREQDVRLASLEASVGSSANKARPPPTTNKRTPPTTARGDSAVRAAAEPVARSEASGAVDFNQLLLSSRQLTPVDAIQLEGSEEIGAIAISNSLLQRPTPSQPLAGPKFVGVAGTNGSLLVLDSSGRPLTPPVRLPAPAAALAFSPTEPARLWVALPLEAGAFLLHTYSMRSVRPVPSPQREWHAEWAEEPLPLRLSLEHETRLWWGGADDDSRRAADRADAAAGAAATDPAAGAGTGAAAGAAAPSGDKPGASPAPAAAAPPVGIVALLPSLAGVGEGTAKHRPAASPRGRASVLVAWSDGLVSLADPSGGSTSLPTGLATLRAVARSARSLALASADRVLVLDLAQPGSPAFARECALPSWAAGRISDVAFDAQIPSLMYASTTDGHLLFLRTRAPATEHVTGTGRTRGYECVCAETRRDAAPPPAPPIPPPPPPKSSRSWRGAWSERRANRGTAVGEPQESDVAESTVAAVVWPEVAIASIRGYVLIARAGRLGVLNVSDVYLGADFAAAPIVHDQVRQPRPREPCPTHPIPGGGRS